MEIEFLWWRGCPSWEEALGELEEEMRVRGLDPDTELSLREIATEAEAEALDFPGSPTIRVEGRDILDPAHEPKGLTCRVYRLRDGRYSAVPDRADVAEALTAARRGDGA